MSTAPLWRLAGADTIKESINAETYSEPQQFKMELSAEIINGVQSLFLKKALSYMVNRVLHRPL